MFQFGAHNLQRTLRLTHARLAGGRFGAAAGVGTGLCDRLLVGSAGADEGGLISTAPQVMTRKASAGAPVWLVAGSASCPSLPAAVTQTSPLSMAALAATVQTAVWPSRSDCSYQSK